MDRSLWIIYSALALFFTGLFYLHEGGARGELATPWLQGPVYNALQRINAPFTDLKFRARGTLRPKNRIVVVDIDSATLDQFGHWPWRRDYLAYLIDRVYQAGATVVGLDLVLSEKQPTVPDELEQLLKQRGLTKLLKPFDYDASLERVIRKHSSSLVLSWISESPCRPLYASTEQCPVTRPDALAAQPADLPKLAFPFFGPFPFLAQKTPLYSVPTVIADLPRFAAAGRHGGFANDFRDADGVVRRSSLLLLVGGHAQPALALEMARTSLNERIEMRLDERQGIESLRFANAGNRIPVTPSGMAELNFRGPERAFPYVSALDVIAEEPHSPKVKILDHALVLVGVSALALSDLGATPFDRAMPGVEVHATLLDNLLANDFLRSSPSSRWILMFLMTFGALAYAYLGQRLEAYPTLFLLGAFLSSILFVDFEILFKHNENWTTSFLYLELAVFTVATLVAKYVHEEHARKFLRVAFSKYVAPAVVDRLVKDPKQLSLGGHKAQVTVLFCDIRGFTSYAERVEGRVLAEFLNDYLGLLTDIVFAHGGTLDKYIGDALMAFWGAPLPQAQHPSSACQAALAMVDTVAKHRPRLLKKYGIDVRVGIGIHTGLVTVGNLGSKRSFSYTVIGDDVNLAARLESATKFFEVPILTSEATRALVATGKLNFRPLGDTHVKGRKQGVHMFQVVDSGSALNYSPEALQLFDEGRALFGKREFRQAAARFEAAQTAFRSSSAAATHAKGPTAAVEDGPTKKYLELCRLFAAVPPSADWDGSLEAD